MNEFFSWHLSISCDSLSMASRCYPFFYLQYLQHGQNQVDEPANEPTQTQTSTRKCQTSNANEVQTKRARTEDDEASKSERNNEQDKKKERKGTKKRGSNLGKPYIHSMQYN